MLFHRSIARTTAVAALLFCASLAFGGNAQALTISSGGFDQALGCSDVACGATQTLTFDPNGDPVAVVSGNVDLDTMALTLSFSFSVVELSMTPVSGTDDNGASAVVFTNTTYAASGVPVMNLGGGNFLVGPAQTASVSGSQEQVGVSAAAAFAAPLARLNGSCLVVGDGLSCGLSFGQSGFSFDVGATPDEEARYFQHTANILAVPEPTTAALMGLALFGIAVAGRRR